MEEQERTVVSWMLSCPMGGEISSAPLILISPAYANIQTRCIFILGVYVLDLSLTDSMFRTIKRDQELSNLLASKLLSLNMKKTHSPGD